MMSVMNGRWKEVTQKQGKPNSTRGKEGPPSGCGKGTGSVERRARAKGQSGDKKLKEVQDGSN